MPPVVERARTATYLRRRMRTNRIGATALILLAAAYVCHSVIGMPVEIATALIAFGCGLTICDIVHTVGHKTDDKARREAEWVERRLTALQFAYSNLNCSTNHKPTREAFEVLARTNRIPPEVFAEWAAGKHWRAE